jgi:hypothetical protein
MPDRVIIGGIDVTPYLKSHRAQTVFTRPGNDNANLQRPIIKASCTCEEGDAPVLAVRGKMCPLHRLVMQAVFDA